MIPFTGDSERGLVGPPAFTARDPDAVSTAPAPPADIPPPSAADFELKGGHGGPGRLDSWCASYQAGQGPGELLRDAHLCDPHLPSRFVEAAAALPEIGTEFCGFKLVAELGRGAFGRVYLSHQGDLANRAVALKVSAEIREESQRLARLQHTNIVPIYSFHRHGPLQAVCMPYFGSATLADVATELSRRDSLPASGKVVASTVYDRRSRTLRNAESSSHDLPSPPISPSVRPAAPVAEIRTTPELQRLEGLTYVESILWIGARLADGLGHAHDRGILHRDLKPANVLVTDDGQPMLLDFNLAEDTGKQADVVTAHVGGTLPYMAPEHLEAFGGTWREVDARSDLYSLGVILFELLTGRSPFIRRSGPTEKILPEMIAERRKGAPWLRPYNKAVSPAAEAIIRKCLHPDPLRRYQSGRELKEDLERHLAHLPLRFQREPSRLERMRKWLRRNSWVRSTGAVATAAVVLITGLAGLAYSHKQRAERQEAINRLATFDTQAQAARALLYARVTDRLAQDHVDEEKARAAARQALALYGLPEDQAWRGQVSVRRLADSERARLAGEIGQILVLLAASTVPEKEATAEQRVEALRLNQLAEECVDAGAAPRALWAQRAEWTTDEAETKHLRELAAGTPAREAWDHYLAARTLLDRRKVTEAVAEARETTRIDPQNFAAWLLLGKCTFELAGNAAKLEAAVHFSTCASLRPDSWTPYFDRGLTRMALCEYVSAEADFSKALELRPELAEAYLQRAHARERLGKSRDGLADAERALEGGVPAARVYLVRSKLKAQAGDKPGAESDLAAGLKETPVNARGWIDRGLARVNKEDWQGALADFAEAVKDNPISREAIHDQAYVLGEKLNQPTEAIRMLDRELELYPNQPIVVAARAVYYAQLAKRDQALADIGRALRMAPKNGDVLYRAACVYALTSRVNADPKGDRRQAIGYLAAALEHGVGFDDVETDTDLTPIRDDANFAELRKLIETTRKFKGWL
jgi:serine/threonine protein kinase/regulator of sirC expression with transglutaminase-like and TPR domain